MKFVWAFFIFLLPLVSFAYSDDTTHPGLTDEIVDLFNLYYPTLALSDGEKELMKNGSTDEDDEIRSMRHFYDPVYNRGIEIAGSKWQSSKDWAQDTLAQAGSTNLWTTGIMDRLSAGTVSGFFSAEGDHSWDRAIYEYVWGDKARAMHDLGHVLHLIEDAAVPDHTRNDPHPPLFHFGSPYEGWTGQFGPEEMDGLAKSLYDSSRKPVAKSDLQGYFDSMATYSNNNFFSKDTISNNVYNSPKVIPTGNFIFHNYEPVAYLKKEKKLDDPAVPVVEIYEIRDPNYVIFNGYCNRLSKRAVLHGAGVVRLFFDEVEKEKESKVLFIKNKSWFAKIYDVAKEKIFGIAAIFYGSSLSPEDVAELNSANVVSSISNVMPIPQNAVLAEQVAQQSEPASVVSSVTPPSPYEGEGVLGGEVGGARVEGNLEVELLSSGGPVKFADYGAGSFNTPRIAPENDNENIAVLVPTPTPTPMPTPTPDTTPPTIYFSVSECSSSISTDGCFLINPNILLSWSSTSTDITSYDVKCEVSGNACQNFSFLGTTATSTNYVLPIDEKTYQFRARAKDTAGNTSDWSALTLDYYSSPVVINEIAWAGTSASPADEWIELYNKTGKQIALANWTLYAQDMVPYLNLSGSISANGYYLVERSDDNTVSDISADLITVFSGVGGGSGLSNSGEVLILSRASTTIDQTPDCGANWSSCGGSNSNNKPTMERFDLNSADNLTSNWGTSNNLIKNGKDANNTNLVATPKARNSINYQIANGSALTSDKTLKKSQSPYVVPTSQDFAVSNGATLTIEPGVVVKMGDQSSITINGDIKSIGSSSDYITFTSIYDDSYAGDTNGDGLASSPQAGDWKYLRIQLPSQNSEINYTKFKYGGRYFSTTALDLRAMVSIFEATTTISNSTFENSQIAGLRATRFNGAISGSAFNTGTTTNTDKVGLYVYEGAPTISGSIFTNNYSGLTLESATVSLGDLSFSSNYLGISSLNSILNVANPSSIIFTNNTATTSPGGLF